MPDVLDAGIDVLLGKVRFLLGGGGWVGLGILQFFCEKSRAPPLPLTSWNGLLHDPSEIPQ